MAERGHPRPFNRAPCGEGRARAAPRRREPAVPPRAARPGRRSCKTHCAFSTPPTLQKWLLLASPPPGNRSPGAQARRTGALAGRFAGAAAGLGELSERLVGVGLPAAGVEGAGAAGGGHASVLCLLDPDPPAHLGVRFNALPGLCRGYSGISSAAQARSPGFRATGHINSGDGVGAVLSPGVRQVHRTQPSASPQGIPRPPGSQPEHPAARRPGCFGPAGFPADRLARAVRTRVPAHAHGKLASAPPPTPGHRRHRAGTEPGPGGD